MNRAMTHSRDHLAGNRRTIITRSLAAAAVGSVPVPGVDDWLASRIARGTISRIAESHGVDADEAAVRAIADGPEGPPRLGELAGGGLAFKLARGGLRRALLAYFAARRARAATDAFAVATLFDHYCARLHVGLGLDAASGAEVRTAIDRAISGTPGSLPRRLARRGGAAAGRFLARAPVRVADALTRGAVARALERRGADELPAEDVDTALERELRSKSGPLARAAATAELQFAAEENPYLELLLENFETLWRRQHTNRDRE